MQVPESDVVEMPYSEVTDEFDVSVLVSWRWSTATEGPKPATLTQGYAPMSAAQFQLMQVCIAPFLGLSQRALTMYS